MKEIKTFRQTAAMRVHIWLLLAAVFCAVPTWGASTQVWEISAYNDFLAGKFENLSLDPDGRLKLGPALENVFSSEQPLIWAVAVSPDGTIYAGTGHEGRVYRITPDGKSHVFWKAPEIEVFALALGPAGSLYAATSPNGKVYRLSADGKAEVFFDPKETYIWSLAFAPTPNSQGSSRTEVSGALYVGTGDQGKIYRVEAANQGAVYFETQQRHVVSLAFDKENRLLAGTDPNGVLYRVDGQGKAFALHDADLPEVRSLQVAGSGDLYAAAVGGGVAQAAESMPVMAVPGAGGTTQTISVTTNVGDGPEVGISQGQAKRQAGGPTPVVTISQPVISYGAEKAAILKVRPDLAVEKLWSSRDENLVALSVVDSPEPQVLLATDKFGRIYRLSGRDISLVAQTDQEQVTQLIPTTKGVLVATAHSGKLFRLESRPASVGGYETGVRDTNKVSRWGRLHWLAETPEGTSIEFFTRSGNSARPDGSWSEWSSPMRVTAAGEGDAPITSPSARFIQWKARLHGAATKTPVLERVRLTYLPQNSAPVLHSIDISAAAADDTSSPASPSTAGSAAESTASFSITVSGSADGATPAATSTPHQTIPAGKQRRLTITWQAEDPDGDKLSSELSFRGEGESAWKLAKKDLTEASFAIDSDTLADGVYWFKVSVSDSPANPPESAQGAERTSQPVLIDHTPPAVRLTATNGRASVQFEAADDASMLQGAEYSIDAGPWVPVFADDGIVDSRREAFTVRLPDLAAGEHLVTLRVRDRAGNAGLAKGVIR